MRETFERALRVVSTEQIFVSTTRAYATEVLQELPEISQNQLILEPEARNTAAAIGLVATCLLARDPEALVATIASDHAIHNPEMFVSALESAFSAVTARPEALATVGINPTKPDTGLGYIKMGQEQGVASGARIFSVEEFKEKPDRETAESYIADWALSVECRLLYLFRQNLCSLDEKLRSGPRSNTSSYCGPARRRFGKNSHAL